VTMAGAVLAVNQRSAGASPAVAGRNKFRHKLHLVLALKSAHLA
jgi:hypothetical protein